MRPATYYDIIWGVCIVCSSIENIKDGWFSSIMSFAWLAFALMIMYWQHVANK